MSDLPSDRMQEAPPFTYCSVDYFGPFYIKDKRKEVKQYGSLFTCLASRDVHIEVADSLNTDSFIMALKCFVSLRGNICELRSDWGTNFVGAERELREAIKEMNHERLRTFFRIMELIICCSNFREIPQHQATWVVYGNDKYVQRDDLIFIDENS